MIADPGRPFSRKFADLMADMQTRLTAGVEMPQSSSEYVYQENGGSYDLPPDRLALIGVWALVPVSGSAAPQMVNCQPGHDAANNQVVGGDYVTRGSKLVWRAARTGNDGPETLLKPGMKFTVEYTVRGTPSGINDFLPGSIAGVLVRAVTREMALMYSQIDEAYRRAFLMQAEGVALENVVALLGVQRNPAVKAVGTVTFAVKQTPSASNPTSPQPIPIPQGTQVADAAGRLFATLDYGEIASNGRTAQINAAALEAGPQGNVDANTITVMPTPPRGVDSVTNDKMFTGGQAAETDDALRERAQHALDRAGKGTLNAIKYAVKEIPEVEQVEVLDHTLSPNVPMGEVHVYYSGGNNLTGLDTKVQAVVNDTRSAGIFARIFPINQVSISGTFYVLPDVGMSDTAPDAFRQDVVAAIGALPAGGALSLRRLNALVYNTAGLKDVAEAQLTQTVSEKSQLITTDPLTIHATDTLVVEADSIKVVVVRALVLAAPNKISVTHNTSPNPPAPPTYTIQFPLQLTDGTFMPDKTPTVLAFNSFKMDVSVTLTATLKRDNTLTAPMGTYTASVTFAGDSKTPDIASIDVPEGKFVPADYVADITAVLSAAAYPALPPITTPVTIKV